METSYSRIKTKEELKKLHEKEISVQFPNHTQQGIFLHTPDTLFNFNYKLIYRHSETCINEIFFQDAEIKYINDKKIESPNAMVWCHNKELEGGIWPNSYSKLENLLNNTKTE